MIRFARNLLVVLFAAVGVFAVAGPANAAPKGHAAWVAPCMPSGHDATVTRGHAVMWDHRTWRSCATGPVAQGDQTNRSWYPARVYGHIWF
jgi:hypothetical protein